MSGPYTDLVGPTLEQILACAKAALDDAGTPVGLAFVAPGSQVAHDNCCEGGGQLWVRLIQLYPTAGSRGPAFPQNDTAQLCGVNALAARIGVGVVRCAHTLDDDGTPPSGEDMTGDALAITQDASTLLQALLCCVPTIPSQKGKPPAKIGVWTPQGPSGGCAGGEWELTVALGTCSC